MNTLREEEFSLWLAELRKVLGEFQETGVWAQPAVAEQHKQEPFTYYDPARDAIRPFRSEGDIPLYTTPPQRTAAEGEDTRRAWIGLTDEERKQLWDDWENGHVVEATEAKLKEKNT